MSSTTAAREISDCGLSITQAARIIGISDRTLWRLIKQGSVRARSVSERRRIIMKSEVERYLAEAA